jgi:L-lactate utilization protein LutC
MKYKTIPEDAVIKKVVGALKERNITAYVIDTAAEALQKVQTLIPHGAEVMTGASITLEQIGFIDLLKSGTHPWRNLKDHLAAEKDPAKQALLRKQATLSQYFLGSVHAITEAGQLLIASNTGSQIPAYAFNSDNVIWVAGAHKIVPTLDDGFTRLKEYIMPLEDQHMKDIGYGGTSLGKMLIFERENSPARKMTVILVKEVLGF